MTKVLINVPRLDRPGGVANYYATIRPLLGQDREYFEIGSQGEAGGFLASSGRIFADFHRFDRLLATGSYGLVHINPSLGTKSVIRDGLFLLLAKRRKKKVLVFFRGWDKQFETVLRSRYQGLFRFVYGKADAFIVLAEEFSAALRSMGIHTPVWLDTTVVADSVFDTSSAQFDARPDGLSVLYMSRIEKGKGCELVVEAYGIFRQRGGSGKLVIAGDGSQLENIQQLVSDRQIPDVEFPGYVSGEAKRAAFLAANTFFYPTFYGEGMPNSVLEAMGYGLPVITRPVAGLKDFFRHEEMGFLSQSEDPRDYAGFLQRLADDPDLREHIGTSNRAYAAERFAASRVVARLEDYYQRTLSL